jgi:hypothetical protein
MPTRTPEYLSMFCLCVGGFCLILEGETWRAFMFVSLMSLGYAGMEWFRYMGEWRQELKTRMDRLEK